MISKKKTYFENLDAMRFILAIMVLLGHSMFDVTLNKLFDNQYYHDFTHGISNGSQAVSFFFVLSGFLITYLLIQEKEKKGTINIKYFYIRRILRIWPVYFFVILFGYFIYPFAKTIIGWETNISSVWWLDSLFLANFSSLYVHANNLVGLHPMMVGITWSVSIEEQFYLFWPLLFFAKKTYLPYLITLCLIISLSFISTNSDQGYVLYYHTLSRIMDLSVGGIFSFFAYHFNSFIFFFKRMSKLTIISVYAIGLIYYFFGHHLVLFSIPFLSRFILCLFYVFIICEQNYAENSLFKFGRWKFGSSQGKYTYGLYMLHPIAIQSVIVGYKILGVDNTQSFGLGILYVFISIIIGYILAYFSFHYFESYFLRLKNKY